MEKRFESLWLNRIFDYETNRNNQQSFVRNLLNKMVVVYLPKQIYVTSDKSVPAPEATVVKSLELKTILYPELEQVLFNVWLKHPMGK